MTPDSPKLSYLRRLLEVCDGNVEIAHVALDKMLNGRTITQLAALRYAWPWHARPVQILPKHFRTVLVKAGRRFGKSRMAIEHVIQYAADHPGCHIGLVGPSESLVLEVLCAGILKCAPPWAGATFTGNEIRFSNGSHATVCSAQEPAHLRGLGFDVAIATEISAWPKSKRIEAMMCLRVCVSEGNGQLIADSTPKRGCPLIKEFLEDHKLDPEHHLLIEGSMRDNAHNLAPGYVSDQERKLSGSILGNQELLGTWYGDEDASTLFRSEWLEAGRRGMPSSFARVVIGVDPSLSARWDAHGIVVAGLGHDGQIYIIENHTAKLDPHEAAAIVVDRALALGVSLVLAEKNRGGQYIRDTVRLTAQARGVAFSEILDERPPAFRKGVVQLRCFMSTEKKIERAQVASVLVQQGLVSLVPGKLGDLEERMICFAGDGSDAGGDDAVDAAVTAILELGAGMKPLDRAGEIGACVTMNKQLVAAHRPETVNARPSAGSALAIFRPAGGGWGGPGGGSYGGGNGI